MAGICAADERENARQELLTAALDALAVHVAVLDSQGRIVAVNAAWRDFAAANGAAVDSWLGADYLAASCGGGTLEGIEATEGIRAVLAGELDEFRLEYPCHSPDELRWFELRAAPIDDGVVVMHTTITERKLAEQRLTFLAHHDELTGLPNRRRMMEALAAAQPGGRLAILLADLDRFKAVNDTHGHAAGNDVLCAVADALARPLPGGSLAARYGGDEFCVALFDCDQASIAAAAETVASRVRAHLDRLATAGDVTISIGATTVAPDESLGAALERADRALYDVKGRGRDGVAAL
jgi:diguanylate cyclase (GGDEF)-like protein